MKTNIKRRDFFKIAATSGAAAALASCTSDPVEKILPSLFPPDNYKAGIALNFASVCRECPSQCGIVVKTREGRAIKIEGNQNHPLNQGKICAIGQAALQGLYNPSRLKKALLKNKSISSSQANSIFYNKIKELVAAGRGKEILFIGDAGDSSLQRMITKIVDEIGAEQIILDATPVNSIKEANKTLYGRYEIPEYKFEEADFLLNFGADFLESWLNVMQNSREFTNFSTYRNRNKNEYVHISPHLSITGVKANEWISCPAKAEEAIALALITELVATSKINSRNKIFIKNYARKFTIESVAKKYNLAADELKSVARRLANSKNALVIGGGNTNSNGNQTSLQLAIAILNYLSGNKTVKFGADFQFGGSSFAKVQQSIKKLKNKEYSLVVTTNRNPAYILSVIPEWKEISKKITLFSLSTAHNETTKDAELVIPITTSFEDWGDSFVRKGIYALQQPVMAKLPGFDSQHLGDVFIGLAKELKLQGDNLTAANFKGYLQSSWKDLQKELGFASIFASFWVNALKNGGIFKDYSPVQVRLRNNLVKIKPKYETSKGMSLLVLNSNLQTIDGNAGDRYWLLETPHPLTQVAWDSWLEINPDKAKELGIEHLDEVEVKTASGSVKLAAYIYNFIDKDTLAIPAGLGREIQFPNYSSRRSTILPFSKGDRHNLVKKKVGLNPFELIPFSYDTSGEIVLASSEVKIKKTGKKAFLVSTDGQYKDDLKALAADSPAGYGERSQKGRHLIRSVSLDELRSGKVTKEGHHLKERHYTTDTLNPSDFYKERKKGLNEHIFGLKGNKAPKFYDPYKFEMTVDLDKCTGCSACITACYAENNIPVVGKERMSLGREMSWIRVERYFDKDKKTGKVKALLSPQMCQQCGNAGCEAVCPVYATYHNPDGLNAQVYNRCVGTRYCSNNCAYKQRRFNWRTYSFPSPLHLQLNPDVTVRDKGVMEKCTFCIQRIRDSKSIAKNENRTVFDGEIKTACQQTCPTDAIVFGNAIDKKSALNKSKKSLRSYHQLEELNFQPNVTYLSKISHS